MEGQKAYTLQVTDRDVQIIAAALGKLPFETVVGLIGNIQKQLADQSKPEQAEGSGAPK